MNVCKWALVIVGIIFVVFGILDLLTLSGLEAAATAAATAAVTAGITAGAAAAAGGTLAIAQASAVATATAMGNFVKLFVSATTATGLVPLWRIIFSFIVGIVAIIVAFVKGKSK